MYTPNASRIQQDGPSRGRLCVLTYRGSRTGEPDAVPNPGRSDVGDGHRWVQALAVAAAYCAASSAAYLLNDLRDRESDRQHPVKRHRPIAAGELSARAAAVLAALLERGCSSAACCCCCPQGSNSNVNALDKLHRPDDETKFNVKRATLLFHISSARAYWVRGTSCPCLSPFILSFLSPFSYLVSRSSIRST